jgi:hypothetical protein
MRKDPVLYLQAQDGVLFQIVADATDLTRNSPATSADSHDITVHLITPQTEMENAVPWTHLDRI